MWKASRANNIKSKQIKLIGRPVLLGWRRLVIDVLSGPGQLLEQLSWTVITLTDMRAALGQAVRILALSYTPVLWSLSPLNGPGGARKQLLPLLIIDYWPASAESSVRSVYIRSDGGSSLCADSSRCVGGGELFTGRPSALCLLFADVCWNTLLEESLVIHGCAEEGALPHYSCMNQSFCCPLGALKKLIEKYNATSLCESDYDEHVGMEAVALFRCSFIMTVQTSVVPALQW